MQLSPNFSNMYNMHDAIPKFLGRLSIDTIPPNEIKINKIL